VSGDPLEGRGEQTDVSGEGNMMIPRDRQTMSTKLTRIAELAKENKELKFLSIAHLLTVEAMERAFSSLRKEASAGEDGITYAQYEVDVGENLEKLHKRLKSGRYRAQPLRRTYVPKEDGGLRPIAIPWLEDKVVQKATVELLSAIYEQDFLGCSYGSRPGRSAHEALDEVGRVICQRPMSYLVEADICGYYDAIVREKLMEMIESRVRDTSMLRLIRKWINVGVIEEGRLLVTKTGVGQGQVISPLLANIYLHYVLDEWFEREVKPRLRGQAYEVRYVDDFILCFQYREDAERVLAALSKRFEKYGLALHPQKTRLIEFGRSALAKSEEPGASKPQTFDFLGFTHICARSRKGKFTIHLRTARMRLRRSLKKVAAWCQEHRHDPVEEQSQALNAKLRGHDQYYGRPTNFQSLWEYHREVRRIWRKWLNRRTRGKTLTWTVYQELLSLHPLLHPRITHSWAGAVSRV
jgi:RNA-directed DNA polymerase